VRKLLIYRLLAAALLLCLSACVTTAAARREEPQAEQSAQSGLEASDGSTQPPSSGKPKPNASDVSNPTTK
jgi:hypothetical protein